MSDTRTLLDRIASFRERLERTPNLIPVAGALDDPEAARTRTIAALVGSGELVARSLRAVAAVPVNEGPLPTAAHRPRPPAPGRGPRADRRQRRADRGPAPRRAVGGDGAASDPLVGYARETVALTDAALRMVQAFPASADAQLRMCDGVEAMLRAVRDRLAVAGSAVAAAQDRRRADRRAGPPAHRTSPAGRAVDPAGSPNWPSSCSTTPGGGAAPVPRRRPALDVRLPRRPTVPAPARFVAAHALTVAQVVARVVPHDYEWAARPAGAGRRRAAHGRRHAAGAGRGAGEGRAARPRTSGGWSTPTPRPGPTIDPRLRSRTPGAGGRCGRRAPRAAGRHRLPGREVRRRRSRRWPGCWRSATPTRRWPATARTARPHDPRTALTDTLLVAEHGRLDRDFTEYLLTLAFHPVGTVVELTDGRVGVVVANHAGRVEPAG